MNFFCAYHLFVEYVGSIQQVSARFPVTNLLHQPSTLNHTHIFPHRSLSNLGMQSPTQVYGPSMLPTMSTHGEAILENRLSFYRHGAASLQRGSMITFYSPLSPSRVVCKRIIGLPGDIVCVDPTGLKAPSTEHAVVPKGHIWVAGDNATWSTDSRDYGPVPMGLVRGHMFARVSVGSFPFNVLHSLGIASPAPCGEGGVAHALT